MAKKRRTNQTIKALVPSSRGAVQRISVDQLAGIPEEEIWLASRKSARTRRAYRNDVAHFMRTFNIRTPDELRRVDHRAVMAWERLMREEQGSQASTVRRRLAALSSLFAHLVKFGVGGDEPGARCRAASGQSPRRDDIRVFPKAGAIDSRCTGSRQSLLGVRDRAILAVGLQVGFRRAEIASLKVGDFHMNRGFDSLKVVRKGGKKGSLAIHPQAAQRIRDYLDLAGHGDDIEGPLFRPVRDNRKGLEARRHSAPRCD